MLEKLLEKYQVNLNWLLSGEGEMFLKKEDEKGASWSDKTSPHMLGKHPLLSELEAIIRQSTADLESRIEVIEERLKPDAKPEVESRAEPSENDDYVAEPEPEYGDLSYWNDVAAGPPVPQHPSEWEWIVSVPKRLIKTKAEDYYVMRVRGNSMIDALIPDGSTIMLRWSNAPHHGAIQAVWIDERVTLKRMMEGENRGWALRHEDGSGRTVPLGEDNYVVGDFVAVLPPSTKPRMRMEE